MKNVTQLLKIGQKMALDNSPTILTVVGVTGTISTAVLAAKGGARASKILKDNQPWDYQTHKDPDLTTREKVELVWKEFIPAAGVGALTITAIVGSNRISTRRAAALAAAYSFSEQAFDAYKHKVVEKLTETQLATVEHELAQERLERHPGSTELVIIADEALFLDAFSGRYFKSTVETIKKAQNDTQYQLNNEGYASLTDFYQRIGLSQTTQSEMLGWTSDKKLEVVFTWGGSEDGRPCGVIDFQSAPVPDYWKHG